jgi:hypothetical protein
LLRLRACVELIQGIQRDLITWVKQVYAVGRK